MFGRRPTTLSTTPGTLRPPPPHPTMRRAGNGGGFAPLEALLRRVAGVSWLYWCNSPRLVVVSLESRPRPGPPALSDPSGERRIFGDGGFAPLGALLRRVAGVSRLYWCNSPRLATPSTWAKLDRAPLIAQFPLFGGGEVAVRGGVAPKVQTTSAKNADNGVSWARWSALWAKLSRTWCVVRTRTCYCVRSPAISHVNPLFRVWAGLPTLVLAGPRAN